MPKGKNIKTRIPEATKEAFKKEQKKQGYAGVSAKKDQKQKIIETTATNSVEVIPTDKNTEASKAFFKANPKQTHCFETSDGQVFAGEMGHFAESCAIGLKNKVVKHIRK